MQFLLSAFAAVQLFASCSLAAYPPHPGLLQHRDQQKIRACQVLREAFPNKVFWSNSSTYQAENNDNAKDIAAAVPVLVRYQTKFAVRGGGHMPIDGAANTDEDGVLIAMSKFVGVRVSTFNQTPVAIVEPGNRWGPVYSYLAARNLTVTGGRYYPVGTGGQPLGGGISYYHSAQGWTVNDILQYEVVTADGKVVLANANDNSDLFWALKGSSNNFGIVTKYFMKAFPLYPVYAGFINLAEKDNNRLVDTVAAYCDPKTGGSLDPKAAIDATLIYSGTDGSVTGFSSIFYNGTGPVPALKGFMDLPTTASTVANRDLVGFLSETQIYGDTTQRKLWGATSIKSTPAAVRLASQVYTDVLKANNASLMAVEGVSVAMSWQPATLAGIVNSRNKGGDALDFDPADGAAILMIWTTSYTGAQNDQFIDRFLKTIINTMDTKSKQQGLYYPHVFLNDAGDFQQDIISLYGKGKSLPRLKQISQKYDPQQVYQRLLKGAFKLGPKGNL